MCGLRLQSPKQAEVGANKAPALCQAVWLLRGWEAENNQNPICKRESNKVYTCIRLAEMPLLISRVKFIYLKGPCRKYN